MSEISRVQGAPGGPADSSKVPKQSDPAKFQELMKVQKVDETDPEQKKKRRQQSAPQEEESTASAEQALAAEPTIQPAAPFQPPATARTTVPAPPAALPTSVGPPPLPSTEQWWEDVSAPPSAQAQPSPPQGAPSSPGQQPAQAAPSASEARAKKKKKGQLPGAPLTTGKPKTPKPKVPFAPPQAATHPAATSQPPSTRLLVAAAEKGAKEAAPQTAAEKEKKKGAEAEPEAAIVEGVSTSAQGQPSAAAGAKEEKKTEAKGTETLPGAPLPMEALAQVPPPLDTTPLLAAPITPYANLHPQVLDLFERMIGVMTVMVASGITETTVSLHAPQFSSSLFFGAEIKITEYSTAPKAFNIELSASPQAVALMEQNMGTLMTAFQSGNYTFKVNRLETAISSAEKPLFHRKEALSRDKEEKDQP